MTTQSRIQEQDSAGSELHVRGLDRLALSKGEGKREGFSRPSDGADFQSLTLILSPYARGEAKEIAMEEH
jgi:hypothetical protein